MPSRLITTLSALSLLLLLTSTSAQSPTSSSSPSPSPSTYALPGVGPIPIHPWSTYQTDSSTSESLARFSNPLLQNGSMLSTWSDTGYREPLNVIISSLSSPHVLDRFPEGEWDLWLESVNFGFNCLGFSLSDGVMSADLGEGEVREEATIRYNYGDPNFGTCRETVEGGNHGRYFRQSSTGAIFLTMSDELDLEAGHVISPNGYDKGRDWLVGNATRGVTSARNGTARFESEVVYLSGMQRVGSEGINHGIPIDGLVALLTITSLQEDGEALARLTRTGGGARRSPMGWMAMLASTVSLLIVASIGL